jgi:hypothetical protein
MTVRRSLSSRRYGFHDKEGFPIFIDRFGSADYAVIGKLITFDVLLMRHAHHMEQLAAQSRHVRPATASACCCLLLLAAACCCLLLLAATAAVTAFVCLCVRSTDG